VPDLNSKKASNCLIFHVILNDVLLNLKSYSPPPETHTPVLPVYCFWGICAWLEFKKACKVLIGTARHSLNTYTLPEYGWFFLTGVVLSSWISTDWKYVIFPLDKIRSNKDESLHSGADKVFSKPKSPLWSKDESFWRFHHRPRQGEIWHEYVIVDFPKDGKYCESSH
jgi:hypothetical protein